MVTVALGSTLATIFLPKEVALAGGVIALALLIVVQFVITWLCVRSEAVRRWVNAAPTLLFAAGRQADEVERSALRAVRPDGQADER